MDLSHSESSILRMAHPLESYFGEGNVRTDMRSRLLEVTLSERYLDLDTIIEELDLASPVWKVSLHFEYVSFARVNVIEFRSSVYSGFAGVTDRLGNILMDRRRSILQSHLELNHGRTFGALALVDEDEFIVRHIVFDANLSIAYLCSTIINVARLAANIAYIDGGYVDVALPDWAVPARGGPS